MKLMIEGVWSIANQNLEFEDDVQIFNRFDDVHKMQFKNARVTIGRFQGVHLGHRQLVDQLGGSDAQSPKVVITFDPPPEDVLLGKIHPKISSSEEKVRLFEELGIDTVFLVPFDQQVAKLTGEEFVQQYILDLFQPKLIVVGYDFAFGKNRSGNVETIKKLANVKTQVVQVESFKNKGDIVSTSLIRKKILEGDVMRASELLARPYPVPGVVMDGAKRGRQLGYPTINLKYPFHRILPKEGVYATRVEIDGDMFLGVTNVGFNPTFSQDQQVKVECHILDFDRDVYHKNVVLHFIDRIRDEKKFSNREELVAAIQKDITSARGIFLPLSNG